MVSLFRPINLVFVFHQGFQTLESNKSTKSSATCFHQFSCVGNPDKTLPLLYEILLLE